LFKEEQGSAKAAPRQRQGSAKAGPKKFIFFKEENKVFILEEDKNPLAKSQEFFLIF